MRLAIVATHPIQYQVPWFRMVGSQPKVNAKVFFLWDRSVGDKFDPGFNQPVDWDVDLLSGYDHEFILNTSSDPGTHRFTGLINPHLTNTILAYKPEAVLFLAYRYRSLLSAILTLRRLRIPLLFRGDSHVLAPQPVAKAIAKKLSLQPLYAMFDAILHVGSANRTYFKQYGVPDKKLFFCPHAVPEDLFPRRTTRLEGDSQTLSLLFSGKLVPKKQPDLLLNCFNTLNLPNASLHFVGTGELSAGLHAGAATNSRVHFHGFLNQTALAGVYRKASLLVLPSRGLYETWGIVVQECAQMGIPALVSSHVGCGPDLVVPGESGFVFNAEDPSDFCRALQEASEARDRLPRMGERACELSHAFSYEAATAGLCQAMQFIQGAQ